MSAPKNNLDAMLAQLGGGISSSPSSLSGRQISSSSRPTILSRAVLKTSGLTSQAEMCLGDGRTGSSSVARAPPYTEPGPSRLPMTPAPHEFDKAATPSTQGASSELDALPFEKLQARIIKNQGELIELMGKKSALGNGQDVMDEDPEMLDMMIQLHSKRLKELQAALSARSQGISSSTPSGTASRSVGLVLPPTPSSTSGGTGPTTGMLPHESQFSSRAGPSVGRRTVVVGSPVQANASASPSGSRTSLSKPAPYAHPSTSSSFDEHDISIAEELVSLETHEIIPPSTPPAPVVTPPRPDRNAGAIARQLAIEQARREEAASLALAERRYPSPRAEASSSRGMPEASQPSSSLPDAGARAPKVNQIEARPWDKEVEQRLRQVFKLPGFRTHQREAVNETMAGNDVFVLMPTGGGKSLTYQLPAICNGGKTRGVTFVISPLISLISDQSRHLVKLKIPTIAYTGDLTQSDRNMAHELLSRPEPYTKVVFVTPEMMSMGGQIKNIMRQLLRRNRLARFVIDEAHCVSQWGHDFRDDYLKLGNLRKEYPGVPIMALTATAQNKVQDDIIRTLGIQGCKVLKQSFNRPNLHYEVRPKKRGVIEDMVAFINTQGKISVEDVDRPGRQKEVGVSGIIYCSSRNKCEDIAKILRDEHNLGAWHYHAGMSKNDRRKTQEGWQEHKFPVIVATVAFGMGIDKPDVRYVIHHSLPRSLEGYYQETGRAGRDGNHSNCILYYAFGDSKIVFQLIDKDQNLTFEQKERQRDSMQEVLRFCNNKTDCRRTQVLAFFSETFDSANCHQGCDICLARDQNRFTVEDVTEPAINVIQLVQAFDRDDRVTVKMAVDAFRGVGGRGGKGLDQNPHYGSGKDWDRTEAERLFQTLLIEGGLGEWYGANGAGWSNAYLKVGRKAQEFLRRRRRLNMHFRQKSPVKKRAPSKRKSNDAKEGDIGSFARTASNPLARQRSRQQLRAEEDAFENSPWGDTDDEYQPDEEDPIEVSDNDDAASTIVDEDDDEGVPLAIKKRKTSSVVQKPTKGQARPKKTLSLSAIGFRDDDDASVVSVGRADNGTPVEQCLVALRAMMLRVRKSERAAPVIDEETLQMIAATMPINERSLRDIEGMTSGHMKHYAKKILGICVKLLPKDRDPMPPTRSALLPTRPNISAYAYKPSTSSRTTTTGSAAVAAVKPLKAASSTTAIPRKVPTLAAPLARAEGTSKTITGGLFGRPGGVKPVALSLAGQKRPAF